MSFKPVKHTYGSHPRQFIEEFKYDPSIKDTVITIHGGGWVRYVEKPSDYLKLTENLDFKANYFSLDYRLSESHLLRDTDDENPDKLYVKYPLHLLDILQGLKLIFDNFDIKKVHFIGHSVGALFALQLQDFAQLVPIGLSELVKQKYITKDEEAKHLKFVKDFAEQWKKVELVNVIYLSGVYDLPLGLRKTATAYPSDDPLNRYAFVLDAHVSEEQFTEASVVTSTKIKEPFQTIKATGKHIILHSYTDQYVVEYQPLALLEYFFKLGKPIEFVLKDFGLHHDILKDEKAFKIISNFLNSD
ncbi:putative kynurenine formamidase [Wickerhamomyces ciferrii]|uniref:Kynurenine formamidase n=1 Tax=Wickerhamomyces ciferrii (strain ATCC 14091 / BCRC 22168 / CBS 111 / JCM 3599 / NBRC 0793 / NRRL Y-1031 F-60-10) TaxID=1206466 RepID=K0KNN5_WICCF|nr:putative kynurenine formamidase [Wickerhamomyces ciferrii]CCH44606.1 putative kynurenine formamidase [Wickerhamomyces ciferrii]